MTKISKKTASRATTTKQLKSANKTPITKQAKIITLLQRQKGATLAELGKLSGWQEHSIRGFMSGTLKKRMGLDIISEKSSKGTRRYRINKSKEALSANVVATTDTGGKE